MSEAGTETRRCLLNSGKRRRFRTEQLILNPYTDTHCHLDFDRFEPDRNKVISRAWEAGLVKILNPGIDLPSCREAIHLAERYPNEIFAAVGVHPNHGAGWTEDELRALRELAQHPGVVAIGEIGLDYYREYTPHDVQRIMLRQQLNLAAEVNLPVVLHNRESTPDLMKILEEWINTLQKQNHPLAERPGVLHSFSGDLDTAQRGISMGFVLGIGGPVTFKNAHDKKELVRNIPLDRILLETDAPFLTPHPHRGKRNEPGYIPHIAEEIAKLKETSLEEVAKTTTTNAQNLFLWNQAL